MCMLQISDSEKIHINIFPGVCLAESESSLNTALESENPDFTKSYGIFQVIMLVDFGYWVICVLINL